MKLSRIELGNMHAFALEEMQNRTKDSADSFEVHRAKCFLQGLLRAMGKEGYEVTLTKEVSDKSLRNPFVKD